MAAYSHGGGNSTIRVRLYFDYPPPAVVDSRMCWLLVDLNACRVVADLESIIKEKFEFGRGSILNLFIEDCYLPHTESIYVVRDNDSVRVKVHCLTQVNGHESLPETPSRNCTKRQRTPEEEDGVSAEWKKKKRKEKDEKKPDTNEERGSQEKPPKEEKKRDKKRKKKKEGATDEPQPDVPTKKVLKTVVHPVKSPIKHTAAKSTTQNVSSSDSSSSFNIPSKKKPLTSSSPKGRTKPQEAFPVLKGTSQSKQAAVKSVPPTDKSTETSSSDSDGEMELVNHNSTAPGAGRGSCVGKDRNGVRGHVESAKLTSGGAQEPSYHTDSLTNTSVLLQNGAEPAPKLDYGSMPLLAAPPQAGQKIAFKLLELTENYTPEVSEYKEGKIVSFDPTTNQIELELLHASQAPAEPGKFDLVYQNPDGTERVEYAVPRGTWVTERWDSLLEPRLII